MAVIVVDYYGNILIGRTEDARFIDLDQDDKIKEYVYYAYLEVSILEEIVEAKSPEKVLRKYFKVIPEALQSYLVPADINRLRNVLNYYYQITKPKKYISVFVHTYEGKDEITIENLESRKNAKLKVKKLHDNIDYFGPEFNMNRNGLYDLHIIITDDDRMSAKFRCVITFAEFATLCSDTSNKEAFEYFEKVWNGNISLAYKRWGKEVFKHLGEDIYGDDYPYWRTSDSRYDSV